METKREKVGTIHRLGYSCHGFALGEGETTRRIATYEWERMLRTAVASGVNMYDLAPFVNDPEGERFTANVLKPYREDLYLGIFASDTALQTGEVCSDVEKRLQTIGTDYLDYYHFPIPESSRLALDDSINSMFLKNLMQAKEKGLIRHISFGVKGDTRQLREKFDFILRREIPVEMMVCTYHPLMKEELEQQMVRAKERGIDVVILAPFMRYPNERKIYTSVVWGNPVIDCLMTSPQSLAELKEFISMEQDFDREMNTRFERELYNRIYKDFFGKHIDDADWGPDFRK